MFNPRDIAQKGLRQVIAYLAFLSLLPTATFAEKMESSIQEAIYLFEMKGNFSEATSILEKVAKEGDESDKGKAYFYLGKIQELSDNRQSANVYYQQSLATADETNLAYWLAEREAKTSTLPEQILQKPLQLPSPVRKVFGRNPTYLQLNNGSIKKLVSSEIQDIPATIPADAEIYQITAQGIWYKNLSEDSLLYNSFHSRQQNRSYPVSGVLGFFEQEGNVILQEGAELTLIDKKGQMTSIPEKYNNCSIEGSYSPLRSYALNCPDNAIHFISTENGEEVKSIYLYDNITKVLMDKSFIYLLSGNNLYGYNPKISSNPLWKAGLGSTENLLTFENNIVHFGSSGRLTLLDKGTGFIKTSILTEANIISPLAKGTLGLFTEEGSIISVDTLLRPLWTFNFTKALEKEPIFSDEAIYLDFGSNKLQAISPRYYGKKPIQSRLLAQKAAILTEREEWDSLSILLDSLFKCEPGNAEGWFFKALYLENKGGSEKQKLHAWSEAVRLSSSNPQTASLILGHYGKAIGAKIVTQLPISPKTKYPRFFGNRKNLFTLDPAAEQLFCLNPDNGEIRWTRHIGTLDNNPVIDSDDNILAIATKYNLSVFELSKISPPRNLQLPGKAFSIKVQENAIYVITWNGFLMKVNRNEGKISWSRKIFSAPFLMAKSKDELYLCNLEGNLLMADDRTGLIREGFSKRIANNISHMELADSSLFFATTNNKILIHNLNQPHNSPLQVLTDSPVASMQIVSHKNEPRLLVNLANQAILLYTEAGAPLWKTQGKNSVFSKPFVKNETIWIEQGEEIVSIDLKDGKIQQHYNIPGGSGTPFVTNNVLFTASPKRILYGFAL
ncbi:MAG: hypothetical protein HUK20_14250 [Fibrobacter sp.]|nr:hypothetical protein [Fibrobacter sp.]